MEIGVDGVTELESCIAPPAAEEGVPIRRRSSSKESKGSKGSKGSNLPTCLFGSKGSKGKPTMPTQPTISRFSSFEQECEAWTKSLKKLHGQSSMSPFLISFRCWSLRRTAVFLRCTNFGTPVGTCGQFLLS
eukprot:symbB.v1.2.037494.t1/scaffold5452.1/size29116/2